MLSLESSRLSTKIERDRNSILQKYLETLGVQIQAQLPIWGCIIMTQDETQNRIEAIYFSNNYWQKNQVNLDRLLQSKNSLTDNFKLNFNQTESEIYDCSQFLGYMYLVETNSTNSQYLILFCEHPLSVKQKTALRNYNQLLRQYLKLEAQYQAKQCELKTLEALYYQMGHQLRNSLAEINIIAETINLSSTTNFCKSQAEAVKKKVIKLNSDIRTFLQSRKCASYQKSVSQVARLPVEQNLRETLEASINEFKNLIQNKKLQINYPQQTVLLAIDAFGLRQIFDNLLSNAIYFSPQEGTINFQWQIFQTEILISICDRGCGLSSEDRQNMFSPFYTHRQNGQGLGLTIVKKIITDLKGSIWADNLPQGGTKISFVLPRNS